MRIILQRVKQASVTVDQSEIASIEEGLLLLVGFSHTDDDETLIRAANKVTSLRVFENEDAKPHFSVTEIEASLLAVPQFTLYGEVKKGRRPDFTKAMRPDEARLHFDKFIKALLNSGIPRVKLKQGQFGANMQVSSINDGPFTLFLQF